MISGHHPRFSLGLVLLLATAGCSKKASESAPSTSRAAPGQRAAQAAGILWTAPALWARQPDRPMRVATYRIPAAPGDSEDAECAAYFFGTGQGGSVEGNLSRWVSQFEPPDGRSPDQVAEEHKLTISGLNVYTLNMSGTYLAAAGPMSHVTEKKPHFAMLGAVIEAPQGLVFFKLTGPEKTVESASGDFNALLQTLHLTPTT